MNILREKKKIDPKLILFKLVEANIQVAKFCNHQSGVEQSKKTLKTQVKK